LDQVKRVVKESPDYVTLLESLVSDAQSEKEQLYALQLETDTIEQEIQRVEATIAAVEKSLGETRKKTQELSDHRRASAREATTATGNYMSTAMTLTATTSNSWVFLLFGSTVILAVLLMVTIIATATNTNSATYV
jgi:predicted  nucleic acid-binding Zn-ribbon protein